MADILSLLNLEHRQMRAALTRLEQYCDGGVSFDRDGFAKCFDFVAGFLAHCHHVKEDLLYRKLLERKPDSIDPLPDLPTAHQDLNARLDDLRETMAIHGDHSEPLHVALTTATLALVNYLRQHFDAEERTFFPLAIAHLTRDDWDTIDYAVFDDSTPVVDPALEKNFRSLLDACNVEGAQPLSVLATEAIDGPGDTMAEFNLTMTQGNHTARLNKINGSAYCLLDGGTTLVTFPACDEKLAAWSAWYFLLGKFTNTQAYHT